MTLIPRIAVIAVAFAAIVVPTVAQDQPSVVPLATSKFAAFPNAPACLTGSVQRGDPAKGPSVLLIKLTAGCVAPWHWHSTDENVFMLSGKGKVEMKGEATKLVTSSDYFYMPAKHEHQFTCITACSFFNMVSGPFDIHYVDADGKEISLDDALKMAHQSGTMKKTTAAK